mgnify:CR=1 FL=1
MFFLLYPRLGKHKVIINNDSARMLFCFASSPMRSILFASICMESTNEQTSKYQVRCLFNAVVYSVDIMFTHLITVVGDKNVHWLRFISPIMNNSCDLLPNKEYYMHSVDVQVWNDALMIIYLHPALSKKWSYITWQTNYWSDRFY